MEFGQGENVDVVVVDCHLDYNHPEFAVNEDGSGGSRVINLNWFEYSEALGYKTPQKYKYDNIQPFTGRYGSHGTHIAGIIAGNTKGWAKKSNIYNIHYDYRDEDFDIDLNWKEILFDYIKYFHKNKPINPSTGRKNPTIVNNSWDFRYQKLFLSHLHSYTYRGITTDLSSFDVLKKINFLKERKIPKKCFYNYHTEEKYIMRNVPLWKNNINCKIDGLIDDGIISVESAGNNYFYIDVPGGLDYDNYFTHEYYGRIYLHRGSSPIQTIDEKLVIGSVGDKYKTPLSNFGPAVDFYISGENICSSVRYRSGVFKTFCDNRKYNSEFGYMTGTSQSTAQVSGIIACILEKNQDLNQRQIKNYFRSISNNKVIQTKYK